MDVSTIVADLCKNNIIYISSPKSLLGPYYVRCNSFRFKLVLFPSIPRKCQLMCLDTFKLMTWSPDKDTISFKDYLEVHRDENLASSLFSYVADDVAVSFMVGAKILVFNEGLYLRDTSDPLAFGEQESTMFELFQMDDDYKKQLLILTNTPPQFPLFVKYIRPIDNLSQLFYTLFTEYDYLPSHIIYSMNGKPVFPVDYYLDHENWCYIDRKYDIVNDTHYKRKGIASTLAHIQSIPENAHEWVAMEKSEVHTELLRMTGKSEVHTELLRMTGKSEVHALLPKMSSMVLVLHKILGITDNQPILYSSFCTYCMSTELIRKRPKTFYNTLYTLLQKNRDEKVHVFLQMLVFTVFYYVRDS